MEGGYHSETRLRYQNDTPLVGLISGDAKLLHQAQQVWTMHFETPGRFMPVPLAFSQDLLNESSLEGLHSFRIAAL